MESDDRQRPAGSRHVEENKTSGYVMWFDCTTWTVQYLVLSIIWRLYHFVLNSQSDNSTLVHCLLAASFIRKIVFHPWKCVSCRASTPAHFIEFKLGHKQVKRGKTSVWHLENYLLTRKQRNSSFINFATKKRSHHESRRRPVEKYRDR